MGLVSGNRVLLRGYNARWLAATLLACGGQGGATPQSTDAPATGSTSLSTGVVESTTLDPSTTSSTGDARSV